MQIYVSKINQNNVFSKRSQNEFQSSKFQTKTAFKN